MNKVYLKISQRPFGQTVAASATFVCLESHLKFQRSKLRNTTPSAQRTFVAPSTAEYPKSPKIPIGNHQVLWRSIGRRWAFGGLPHPCGEIQGDGNRRPTEAGDGVSRQQPLLWEGRGRGDVTNQGSKHLINKSSIYSSTLPRESN